MRTSQSFRDIRSSSQTPFFYLFPKQKKPQVPDLQMVSVSLSFFFFFAAQPQAKIHTPLFSRPALQKVAGGGDHRAHQDEARHRRVRKFVSLWVCHTYSLFNPTHHSRRYVITNKKGQVLRRFHTMSEEKAEAMAATMRQLAVKAQNVARDLNPSVSRVCVYSIFRSAAPPSAHPLPLPHSLALLPLLLLFF